MSPLPFGKVGMGFPITNSNQNKPLPFEAMY